MITKEDYLNALKSISENQKIVDQYRKDNFLSNETKYTNLKLSDISVVECQTMHNKNYLSFQVNDNEVQRIEDFTIGLEEAFLIQGGRYGYDADKTMKTLCMWFKRRGMKISISEFRDEYIDRLNYLRVGKKGEK